MLNLRGKSGRVADLAKIARKSFLKTEVVLLLLLVVGFFCIFPSSLNYGDHSSWGMVFQKNLINYIKVKKNFEGDFFDYYRSRYKAFHWDKINLPDASSTYGVDPFAECAMPLSPTHYTVFIFSRLTQLGIHFFSGGILNVEQSLMVFSLIIFILTYIYAYKLGRLLVDRRLGVILAVVVTSNIYFNQLVRSMIFPFITLYPLLFLTSFYYLFLSHRRGKATLNWGSVIGLSVALAAAFLNGYPNTNVLLYLLLLASFFLLVMHIIFLKNQQYRLLNWRHYLFILLFTPLLIIVISGWWSNLLGQHIFYGLNSILHDRVWGLVLQGKSLAGHQQAFNFSQLPKVVTDTIWTLFVSSKVSLLPHEASFLNDLAFFNVIEAIFFLLGMILILKKIFSKNLVAHWLFLLGGYFFYRRVSNLASHLVVARFTFDFYFVIVFIAAYGFYKFSSMALIVIKNFLQQNSYLVVGILFFLLGRYTTGFALLIIFVAFYTLTRLVSFNLIQKINLSKRWASLKRKRIGWQGVYLILAISLLLNIYRFNAKFVWQFDEGLNQSFGVYRLKQLYRNEIKNKYNLVIYDYTMFPHGYLYHIDLFALLEGQTDYEVFDKVFNSGAVDSEDSFKRFVEESPYENIYVILHTSPYRLGKEIMYEPDYDFHPILIAKTPYFKGYEPYMIIRNRRGTPTFWVYKFTKISARE